MAEKFQETFKELHQRVCDLKDMIVYDDEWNDLDRSERSAVEDMIGDCESYIVMAQAVLTKHSKHYAELHGKENK